jgi:arylsulfatase
MVKMGIIDKSWPLTPRNEKVTAWKDLDAKRKKDLLLRMEIYAAMIDRMDHGIGRVIEKLKAIDALDNTLVLFLSDNGGNWEGGPWGWDWGKGKPGRGSNFWCTYGMSWGNLSNTPFRLYKHWVHEGGIATPLIAHWPAVVKQKGKLTDQVGHIIDIMATFCNVAGAKYPAEFECKKITPLEGKSLLPILQGKKRAEHEALFWEHTGNKAVRAGKWKLVSRDGGVWELYDLEKDRTELTDLAAKNPAKVQELKASYEAWAKRCGVLPWPVKKKKRK